ncbi:MAG: hypothetical protein OXC62_01445 [Aestuariivita sp.]|nr:hypothetical protein [Aestuariivita sp.]
MRKDQVDDNTKGNYAGSYDSLSGRSYYIRMFFGETLLASGTCFFVSSPNGLILITNRHNFTGRDNITRKTIHDQCALPNHAVVSIYPTSQSDIGADFLSGTSDSSQADKVFLSTNEVHYHIDLEDHDNPGEPSWVEHPTLGKHADIVALPVKELEDTIGKESRVLDLSAPWYRWGVGSELYVIGYPFGHVSAPFPIWSKGFMASEPDIDISELPIFLIDCRSRKGQSGSPVWGRFGLGDVVEHEGKRFTPKGIINHFLGVYSGRLNSESDLGFVWKRSCIEELVNHAAAHGTQHQTTRRRCIFHAPPSHGISLERLVSDNFEGD